MSQKKERPAAGNQPETGRAEKDQATTIIPETLEGVKTGLNYLIEAYKDLKDEQRRACQPYERELSRLRADIRAHLETLGERSYKCEAGHAYIVDRVVIRYNAKALDAVCSSFPEVSERIAPHRKETLQQSLTVR